MTTKLDEAFRIWQQKAFMDYSQDSTYAAFKAGAAWERERILAMLGDTKRTNIDMPGIHWVEWLLEQLK